MRTMGWTVGGARVLAVCVLVQGGLLGTARARAEGRTENKATFPIFWTWGDKEIEDHALMTKQFQDIRQAGFGGVHCMPRATRYHIFDPEVTAAVAHASRLCRESGLELVWGPDPRFAATHIVRKTGYGAEMLMVNRDFQTRLALPEGADPARHLLNEAKVENGRYSLHYNYPSRRDAHMLTEVSLWLNPVAVEKVYAYQRQNGKVVRASVRDITPSHHLFVNRAFYYVEVFGRAELPPGEWYVFAFPRFTTNMYAYDSPDHEALFLSLIDEYKRQGIAFDGFWWDEPGYYFQFGHFAYSRFIAADFQKKYGYDLKESLYRLVLDLDDESHIKTRYDYFQLLMDYVFGGQRRLWQKGEGLFGPLRMGIHQTWHWLPDDVYAGAGDVWRGLASVDGGYTDEGNFERYFRQTTPERYVNVSRMMVAKSLAKFSRSGRAYFNQWGVQYGNEVPLYWNDLMAAFSNEWINHCYGYTGVLGADRSFGPGFPNHESWTLSAGLNERNRQVLAVTQLRPALAAVAIVYPNPTIITGWAPETNGIVEDVDRLIGAMPALGIQADVISVDLLAAGTLKDGQLAIRDQRYKALVLPNARVLTPEAVRVIAELRRKRFPLHFGGEPPSLTTTGERVTLDAGPVFRIPSDATELAKAIEALRLPSPCGKLNGAYLHVIQGQTPSEAFLTVMPVDPKGVVSGKVRCLGQNVDVAETSTLAIYKVDGKKRAVSKAF
jgi:hypothetical protein